MAIAATNIAEIAARPPPMIDLLHRTNDTWLVRLLGNAGLLALTILFVTSLGLGRPALALVWFGALLVLFVQTCEAGRQALQRTVPAPAARRADMARLLGAALALVGVITGLL